MLAQGPRPVLTAPAQGLPAWSQESPASFPWPIPASWRFSPSVSPWASGNMENFRPVPIAISNRFLASPRLVLAGNHVGEIGKRIRIPYVAADRFQVLPEGGFGEHVLIVALVNPAES